MMSNLTTCICSKYSYDEINEEAEELVNGNVIM